MKNPYEDISKFPVVEPDEWDLQAIKEFEAEKARGEDKDWIAADALRERIQRANGRISLRVPRKLHAELIEAAEDNNVSLNQYITYLLARELNA